MIVRDLSLAYQFCNTLAGDDAELAWRAIPESAEAKARYAEERKKKTGKQWHPVKYRGTLYDYSSELERKNDQGFGIFVTINATDRKGEKEENVTGIRALFIDKDDGDFSPGTFDSLATNIIVQSGNGQHAYWLLKPNEDLTRFRDAQKHLIDFFRTDKAVHDLPRVMRVPGFLHCKGAPKLVTMPRCVDRNEGLAVGIDDVLAAYPAPPHVDQDISDTKSAPITPKKVAPVKSDHDTMVFRAKQYLATIPGTTEGNEDGTPGRNQLAVIVANKVGDFVDIESGLALVREWNRLNNPPLDDDELEKAVRSAYRSRQRPVGWRSSETLPPRQPMQAIDFVDPITGECHPASIDAAAEDKEGTTGDSFGPRFGKITGDHAGQLFLEHNARDVVVNYNDQVFVYVGAIWKPITKTGLKTLIADDLVLRKVNQEGLELTPTCGVNALKTAADRICIARHRKTEPVEWNQLEDDEIPFADGVYDVVNQTLRPHERADMLDKTLPHKFPDKAMPPMTWLRCLQDWFPMDRPGNRDKVEALQEFMGYILLGHARYKKAAVLYGESNTGKSLVLKVIGAMVGFQNACSIKLEDMSDPRKVAAIHGKMVNIITEIDEGALIADGGFKQLVSTQEPIQIDPKYVAPYVYSPSCKHIFATNNLPRINDRTNAVFNRLMVCTFERVFEKGERDEDLDRKLMAELPAIIMWAIEGAERLVAARGEFTPFKDSDDVVSEYREQDPLMTFIEECCTETGNMRDGVEIGKFTEAFNLHKGGKKWTRQTMGILLANLPGTDKRYHTVRAKRPGERSKWTFVPGLELNNHAHHSGPF